MANKCSTVLWFHPVKGKNSSIVCDGVSYNHWHMAFIPDTILSNDSTWKSLRQSAKNCGVGITLQQVNNPVGFCAHMLRPPRMCFGVRELGMAEYLVKGYKGLMQNISNGEIELSDISTEIQGDVMDADSDESIWNSLGFGIPQQTQREVGGSTEGKSLLEMFDDKPSSSSFYKEMTPADCGDCTERRPVKRQLDMSELDEENYASKKHQKMTNTAVRIKELTKLFQEYHCNDLLTLLQKSKENSKDYDLAYVCFTAANQKQLEDKAAILASNVTESKPLLDIMLEAELNTPYTDHGYLTQEETYNLFMDWCNEQNIDVGKFILEYWQVLTGNGGKKNSFILQGDSNAGKTVWLDAMLFVPALVGYVTKSENFAFQQLPGSRVARCDEILLSQSNVDDYKRLLSGEEFSVQIKNQGDKKISGLPVFGSCNNAFIQFIAATDGQAIMNRVFLYSSLRSSDCLRTSFDVNSSRRPNPRFFQKVLKELSSYDTGVVLDMYNSILDCDNAEATETFIMAILCFD